MTSAVDLGISIRLKYGFLLEVRRLRHSLCMGFDNLQSFTDALPVFRTESQCVWTRPISQLLI
jgi:hypothetical protein